MGRPGTEGMAAVGPARRIGGGPMTLPAIRPGVRWVPPVPGEPDLDPAGLLDPDPADEFDPSEEDREVARMAADIGEEVTPY